MTAATPPREGHDPEASGRTLFALALLAGALLRLVLLGAPDLAGSDEGLWAVSARNVVEGGFGTLFGVGRTPLGPPAAVPVFFPWLLHFMVRIFGPEEWAIRLPSVAAGLLGAFVLERIVRRGYGQPAGHLAGAFAALFPPLVAASRAATVEATVVTLGLLGVIFGLRALEEGGSFDAALSGLSFGLGLLAKGPAVLLFVAPLLFALFFRPRLLALGRTRRMLLVMAATFAAPAVIHLGSVAVFRPANLSVVLASLWGASSEGPSGTWGTELKAIVRTLGLFLPLVGAGVAYLFRALGEREVESGATGADARLSHDALWATYMVELVVLVAVNGRFQLGTAPAMPVLAAFSGFGATALFLPNREAARRAESRFPLVSGAVALVSALLLFELGNLRIEKGGDPTLGLPIVLLGIAAATAACALLAVGVRAPVVGERAPFVLVALYLVFAGFESARVIRRDLLTHRTFSRELAEEIAPLVAALPPETPSFRAPEPDAVSFRLFRSGLDWRDVRGPDDVARDAGRVAFWAFRESAEPGPEAPPAAVREWLAAHAEDRTGEVDARARTKTGLRLYVPRVAPPAASPRA